MKCSLCFREFEEKYLHESHDVPTYLWEGNRQGRKNQADKFGRHWLCKSCHDNYEEQLRISLRINALQFAEIFFKKKEEKEDDTNNFKQ